MLTDNTPKAEYWKATCPKCKKTITVWPGVVRCPTCRTRLDVTKDKIVILKKG